MACKAFSLLRLYDLAGRGSSRVLLPFRTLPLLAMGIQIAHYMLC